MAEDILMNMDNVAGPAVAGLKKICLSKPGTVFSSVKDNNGNFSILCTLPIAPTTGLTLTNATLTNGGSASATATGGTANVGTTVQIDIGATELDALSRVAASEVGHFAKYGDAMLRGGLCAVVDTILNRVAHAKHPDSIETVVDKPFQFSAINPLGTWSKLPAASATIAEIIHDYIAARAAGAASEIKGATHFLNPHLSSANAMAEWGNHVVNNPVAIYGNDTKKDVHYHGFPPGGTFPQPYTISFGGQATTFVSAGSTPGGGITRAELRDEIVRRCHQELAFFDNGSAKESDDPQFKRIGEYWSVVGLPINGRTQQPSASGKFINPPWSAVFISHVIRNAGANDDFPAHQAHCHYFQHFIEPSIAALYEAVSQMAVVPEVGDILHYGRGGAKHFDFAEARGVYATDSFYSSHSDIVIAVDLAAGQLTTVGGNVSNSVKTKTVKLDGNGHLRDRREGGQSFPWIGILKLRL